MLYSQGMRLETYHNPIDLCFNITTQRKKRGKVDNRMAISEDKTKVLIGDFQHMVKLAFDGWKNNVESNFKVKVDDVLWR